MTEQAKSPTAYGYDGNGYGIGDRVRLHPSLDLWMQGDRYGTVRNVRILNGYQGRDVVRVTVITDRGTVVTREETLFQAAD